MLEGKQNDWKAAAGMGMALFLLLMARACAFGAQYYPQLDDYIQYHNYPSASSLWALHQATGLLGSRPLAGAADFYLWGPLFDHMILGVALISALYAAAVLIIWKILGRYFRVSPVCPVFMALLPLGMEGVYWMSASSRVVVGMFLAALTAWAFLKWLDRGGGGWLALYLVLQLLPFGFYEQGGILSVTLTVGAAILEWTLGKKPLGRCAASLWGVPAMGLYLMAAKLLSSGGVYSSRMEILLPFSRYYWLEFLPRVLGQLVKAFLGGGAFTLVKGFIRGMEMVLTGELAMWAAGMALLCGLLFVLARRCQHGGKDRRPLWLPLVCGLLLAAGPVSLFLVLGSSQFALRNTVASFPGAALMLDALLLWLWDRLSLRREGLSLLAAGLAFVFCVAGASEVRDYRDTYRDDQRIAALVLDALAQEEHAPGRVGVLNLEPSYLSDQNFCHFEHIHGCTESEWAFTGMLTARAGREAPPTAPLPADPMYLQWNAAANDPAGFDRLYFYNGTTLERAELEARGEKNYIVHGRDGDILGYIWDEDGTGYFRQPDQMTEELLENF